MAELAYQYSHIKILDFPIFAQHDTLRSTQELLRNRQAQDMIASALAIDSDQVRATLESFLDSPLADQAEVDHFFETNEVVRKVWRELDTKTRNRDPDAYVKELLTDPLEMEKFAAELREE